MFQKMTKMLNNKKGFTLVELMVVVAIIGVLTAIAVPVYNSVTANAKLAAVKANLRTIDSAIMQATVNGVTASQANLVPTYLKAWPTEYTYAIESNVAVVTTDETIGSGDDATVAGMYKLEGDALVAVAVAEG